MNRAERRLLAKVKGDHERLARIAITNAGRGAALGMPQSPKTHALVGLMFEQTVVDASGNPAAKIIHVEGEIT